VRILDQELVIHAFAAADGPGAAAAYRAVDEIWRGCGRVFGMTETIPSVSLPRLLSSGLGSLPLGREAALAAQESRDANAQAVLRIHRDVLNLSVALAKPEGLAATEGPDEHRAWWRDQEIQWRQLTQSVAPHLFGEARLYLARVDDEAGIGGAAPTLYHRLGRLLPDAGEPQAAESTGVSLPRGFALWETATEPDERALRQFVLAIAPDSDPAASAWAWSRGDTRIPPLARYLLHAAKIRYELRVWQRDGQARQLRSSLDAVGEDLRRRGATDAAQFERLKNRRRDALLQRADLDDLRHTVAIAADNLGRAFDLTTLKAPGSPFADDAVLAESMLERLDDEIAYLDQATERAHLSAQASPATTPTFDQSAERESAPATSQAASGVTVARPAEAGTEVTASGDRRRNVFVVYGRDGQEHAIFEFLRAIDLRPLQWESVVAESGNAAPSLAEAVRSGLAASHAVVVLLTPDDEVRLHPDLHQPDEGPDETEGSMQPRPNVLLELGMAMMSHPARTLMLGIGKRRPVTDLGGLNYITIADTVACRQHIANRLQLAGCRVDLQGDHWLKAGDFASLAASGRRRPGTGSPAA
jgi:predicted nucleotide-binding protein